MPITFGIIGGDKRQIYLAKALSSEAHIVYLNGLEQAEGADDFQHISLPDIGRLCEVVILPLPATRDGKKLNAPFTSQEIFLGQDFAKAVAGCKVIGGMTSQLPKAGTWKQISPLDYYDREELIIGNAMLTAEAAIAIAIQTFPATLNHSSCLVTGFGRIGKWLCHMLKAFHANVDCAARKKSDFMEIENRGCRPIEYKNISQKYDIIFNTVPVKVLGKKQLIHQDANTLIIELASAPGGICLEAAKEQNLRVMNAQSLPGKISPKTSGEYIKQTIYNILEE